MAKAKPKSEKINDAEAFDILSAPRPRLKKLEVRNFRAIGPDAVTLELDDVVVLVGPNNCGKSSILHAYEVVMEHKELTREDFPDAKVNSSNPIEIILETIVYDENAPGKQWIHLDPDSGEMIVRERWTWSEPGAPKKVGWDVAADNWHDTQGPWGATNVAKAFRPEPHRILPFDEPNKQSEDIVKLLKGVLDERIKTHMGESLETDGDKKEVSHFRQLMSSVAEFQKMVVADAKEQISLVEDQLSSHISKVFPGHVVTFDAKPEEEITKCLNFFKESPQLRMGPSDGYQPAADFQGSGARRTLLWAALRLVAEQPKKKKESTGSRPHVLLMDEPELCLHPNAVREACRVLYDLPKSGNWQVVVTTHSPIFIDFWRDNTSIVRVERKENGVSSGTTIYRPSKAQLSEDDKECLKLLNLCDPYVAEFFFGGRTIIVEGDTEHTAFTYVIQQNASLYKDVHIVRARGKATIVSLCKILNQFNMPYAILHDSDRPTAKDGKTNSSWTLNSRILDQVKEMVNNKRVRLIASIPNFEEAYLEKHASRDKPHAAWDELKSNSASLSNVKTLLDSLLNFELSPPTSACEWIDLTTLEQRVSSFEQLAKKVNKNSESQDGND